MTLQTEESPEDSHKVQGPNLFFLYHLNVIFSLTLLTVILLMKRGVRLPSAILPETGRLSACSSLPHTAGGRHTSSARIDGVVTVNVQKVTLAEWGACVRTFMGTGSSAASQRNHLCNKVVSWACRFVPATSFLPWKNNRQTVVMELGSL